ncbi:hypothetical protein GEMRC1_004277 [Eukaryota sp. GEM-RC1]
MTVLSEPPLLLLLESTSKHVITECISLSMNSSLTDDASCETDISSLLSITDDQSHELRVSIIQLVKQCVDKNLTTRDDISKVFSDGFHPQLRGLLSKQLSKLLPDFKSRANIPVFLPRLLNLSSNVVLSCASSESVQMTAPSAHVSLQLKNTEGKIDDVSFEMNKDSLSIMLDGLSKIKDQLAGMV